MALSDRELLARLIQCEAGGEGDAGMRAVAAVTKRILRLQDVFYLKYKMTLVKLASNAHI